MLKLTAIGRIGRDAVVRHANNKTVVSFPIAHNEKYTDAKGVKHEKTVWLDCSLWRDQQTSLVEYLQKGQQVYVEGNPSTDVYTNEDTGEVRSSLKLNVRKLELLGSNNNGDNGKSQQEKAEASADDPNWHK